MWDGTVDDGVSDELTSVTLPKVNPGIRSRATRSQCTGYIPIAILRPEFPTSNFGTISKQASKNLTEFVHRFS